MSTAASSPFSGRTVLAMLLFGALAFLLALYFIGAGETGGGTNDGGGHAGAKGLNGYAALAQLLERRGWEVTRSRNEANFDAEGLVILTPPIDADGEEIVQIVERRRSIGPTIIVLPKWHAMETGAKLPGTKRGWVVLGEAVSPRWEGFADTISITLGKARGWTGAGIAGKLPAPARVQWAGRSAGLEPLVTATDDTARMLAASLDDGDTAYPLLIVFEPDLLNNMGMARGESAVLAQRLITDVADGQVRRVHFDLTLNGLGRTPNLLTLAFTPPFLAATLCLVLGAAIIAWRALRRFGPPLAEARRIAFGKRQLVRNSAGLILRTRRFHLLGPPYAALLQGRIARLLGHRPSAQDSDIGSAIDRALYAQGLGADAFTTQAERLRAARRPHELLRAAQAIKHFERTLEK